jgi:SAM-dependent methyltransferase
MGGIRAMSDLRKTLSDQYLSGFGIEIGAGLLPTSAPNVLGLVLIDKRNPEELAAYFGRLPDYEVLSPIDAVARFGRAADFVLAHHVIEHCDNPIAVLANEWLPMLKPDGLLYLSLPSSRHSSEDLRLPTPIDHLLDDYYFERPSTGYESKEHIYSFVLQWTIFSPGAFGFANSDLASYATGALDAALPDTQDLHWHTYTMRVAVQMIEAAFHVAGRGLEWLRQEETDTELHLLCKSAPRFTDTAPEFLNTYRERLLSAAGRI